MTRTVPAGAVDTILVPGLGKDQSLACVCRSTDDQRICALVRCSHCIFVTGFMAMGGVGALQTKGSEVVFEQLRQ